MFLSCKFFSLLLIPISGSKYACYIFSVNKVDLMWKVIISLLEISTPCQWPFFSFGTCTYCPHGETEFFKTMSGKKFGGHVEY